jgi:hypothetical protein
MWHAWGKKCAQVGKREGKNRLQDLGADGSHLKWFLKRDGMTWIGLVWRTALQVAGSYGHGKGLFVSMKVGDFLTS